MNPTWMEDEREMKSVPFLLSRLEVKKKGWKQLG
jgi:hypothetical protein